MEAAPLGSPTPPPGDPTALLRRAARRMADRYAGTFARETVEHYLAECHAQLADRATVTTYLPLLAECFAAQRLDALARGTGLAPRTTPEVLFVCTENAGRSQLAAALLRHAAGQAVRVHSVGTRPSAWIDPVALRLMAELDLTPDDEFPKPLTPEVILAADVVITLGCGDACPILPGRRYYDWHLPDLKGLDIESARSVRDGLTLRVDQLAKTLVHPAALPVDPEATPAQRSA